MNWMQSALTMSGQTTTGTVAKIGDTAHPKPQNSLGQILPVIILIGILFYFMIIRPQKKDQKKVADMRESMKKGDRVRTIGGIYGTIALINNDENTVTIQVDKSTRIEMDRAAISTVVTKDSGKSQSE